MALAFTSPRRDQGEEQEGNTSFRSLFSQAEAERQSILFEALASPVRIQILGLLARYGGLINVEELTACLPVVQPTISHHLKILKQAGFLGREKRGLHAYYFTDLKRLEEVGFLLVSFSSHAIPLRSVEREAAPL